MPAYGRRRYRPRSRRGRYRKRRFARYKKKYGSRASTSIVKAPSAIADRTFVKLKFVSFKTIAESGSALGSYAFRGNDCYDPDFAAGGHQPRGFDQWMTFYALCAVMGSKIRVTGQPYNNQCAWGLYCSNDSTGPTGEIHYIMEKPYVKTTMTSSSENSRVLKSYMATKKILAPCDVKTDDAFWCSDAAPPSKQFYWWIIAQAPTFANAFSLQTQIEITYYCMFFGRRTLAVS